MLPTGEKEWIFRPRHRVVQAAKEAGFRSVISRRLSQEDLTKIGSFVSNHVALLYSRKLMLRGEVAYSVHATL